MSYEELFNIRSFEESVCKATYKGHKHQKTVAVEKGQCLLLYEYLIGIKQRDFMPISRMFLRIFNLESSSIFFFYIFILLYLDNK